MGCPSWKLAEQSVGPYTIIEKVGNAYWIDLPESVKVHPVFYPEKLRKASSSEPLEGQILIPQLPVQVNGQDEWDVEQIIAVRLRWQKLSYCAKWVGHDQDLEWYPAGDFKNAPRALCDFHEQHPDLPGPPKRLPIWLKAAEDDEFLEDHEEDN
jgi:hypothetical protein